MGDKAVILVTERKNKRPNSPSAQVGEFAFPAAHLTAQVCQDVVYVPFAPVRSRDAKVFQAVLLPCRQTWSHRTEKWMQNENQPDNKTKPSGKH